jgi:hypothetical protein
VAAVLAGAIGDGMLGVWDDFIGPVVPLADRACSR